MNSSGELATERGVLEYERIENTIRITGYRGKDTAVEVPAIMDGCPVTCIGKKAFLSNKMVKQISLPESILRIEDWAFAFCSKLSKILLPYHSMEIGQGIFKDCRYGRVDLQMGCENAPADADTGCRRLFQDAFMWGGGLWQPGE